MFYIRQTYNSSTLGEKAYFILDVYFVYISYKKKQDIER